MKPDVSPLAMKWARRVPATDPPVGHYDMKSQAWVPSVLAANGPAPFRPSSAAQGPRTGSVVVFARSFDPHADAVVAALGRRGAPVVRINGERLLRDWSVSWRPDSSDCMLKARMAADPRVLRLPDDVASAYYRRSEPLEVDPRVRNGAPSDFCMSESRAMLDGIYSCLQTRWLSTPHAVEEARAKIPQIALATGFGFRVPQTLITSDAAVARDFIGSQQGGAIIKPLHSATIQSNGEVFDLFTRSVESGDLRPPDALEVAPILLQARVPSAAEVRVTVVGLAVFATEITPAAGEATSEIVDRRCGDSEQTNYYRAVELPREVEVAVKGLVESMNLVTASIDLIQTPDGDFYFLELNPNGSWYWLEIATGQPITDAFAALLCDGIDQPACGEQPRRHAS